MKILIIEDEKPAADKLQRLLRDLTDHCEVLGVATSVKTGAALIKAHQAGTDLIFMDIQLTDGLSFKIFEEQEVVAPVIFITAYNQYAIEAFRSNGIDYLLKPLTEEALAVSLKKWQGLKHSFSKSQLTAETLASLMEQVQGGKQYKDRFLVKVGEHIRSIPAREVAVLYADGRVVYLITNQQAKYTVDYTMESLEQMLDPRHFFRTNRTFLVNIDAIRDVLVYSNSRLRISIADSKLTEEIIVSRDRVPAFKEWFGGGLA